MQLQGYIWCLYVDSYVLKGLETLPEVFIPRMQRPEANLRKPSLKTIILCFIIDRVKKNIANIPIIGDF